MRSPYDPGGVKIPFWFYLLAIPVLVWECLKAAFIALFGG